MAGQFAERVALVTGGAEGIGRAAAEAFAREGARVVVADVQEAAAEQTVAGITAEGGRARYQLVDVSRGEEVEALVEGIQAREGRLDIAVNNAGIEGTQAGMDALTEADWDRVIAINLKGVWLCMRSEIPRMREQGGGAIVNISSVAALMGFRGMGVYCASKAGVLQLTKTAALELAESGIRVNAVCPGLIDTAMVDRLFPEGSSSRADLLAMEPVGRMGRPAEIAASILWLCSDAASFVTGHPLVVDGGMTAQ